jgi:hypothetical protein
MENKIVLNPNLGNIEKSAFIIEKVHNCADCPIRKLAVKQPKSLFARMHNWHKTWWPGWKAHQARVCPLSAKTALQAK